MSRNTPFSKTEYLKRAQKGLTSPFNANDEHADLYGHLVSDIDLALKTAKAKHCPAVVSEIMLRNAATIFNCIVHAYKDQKEYAVDPVISDMTSSEVKQNNDLFVADAIKLFDKWEIFN